MGKTVHTALLELAFDDTRYYLYNLVPFYCKVQL